MRFVLVALWALAVGCTEPCIRHSDCPSQLVCSLGSCVMPAIDGDVVDGDSPEAGRLSIDGGTDGTGISDAGMDTNDGFESILDGSTFADAILDIPLMDATMTDADTDAGEMTDAGVDADLTDAGLTDAGLTDAGLTDAGLTDTGDDT